MKRYYEYSTLLLAQLAAKELQNDPSVDKDSIRFGRSFAGNPYITWEETVPIPRR